MQIKKTCFFIKNKNLILETIWQQVTDNTKIVAIICHPHPLKEGTMHNKVVFTIASAFNEINIDTIRFNYRGVGKSTGEYGNMIGEINDLLSILKWIKTKNYNKIILAGFSFGAYIALKTAIEQQISTVLCVAPAVDIAPYIQIKQLPKNLCIIHGKNDEIASYQATFNWLNYYNNNNVKFLSIEAGHFFHHKLVRLKQLIMSNY